MLPLPKSLDNGRTKAIYEFASENYKEFEIGVLPYNTYKDTFISTSREEYTPRVFLHDAPLRETMIHIRSLFKYGHT